jgi:hypothetical protein
MGQWTRKAGCSRRMCSRPGPIPSPIGEDGRVTTRPETCEYVSVSASLQQTIRDREVVSDPAIVVMAPVDDPCGKLAEGLIADREGHERSYCSDHLREIQPYWALARHP